MSYTDLVLGVLENDAKRVHAAIKNGKKLDGFIYGSGEYGYSPSRSPYYYSPPNLKPFVGAELSWIAASLGHSEVLSILLESGAPCSKIKDGMSALQIARHNNRAKCVALLDPEATALAAKGANAQATKEPCDKDAKALQKEVQDAQCARLWGLDGTTLAIIPAEAFKGSVQISVQGVNLSAFVDQKSCLTLSLTRMCATDRGARTQDAIANHAHVISSREEDLKSKLADAAEMQAAAQRCEEVDWQEFAQLQGVIGKHRAEIKALKEQKKVAVNYENTEQVISLTAKPFEVHIPSPLVRVPFVWYPSNCVRIQTNKVTRSTEAAL